MAETVDIPDLERITFFTGQPLTAADLAALQRANRELRWLHNRSLHSWGIGIGLAVTGERGDRVVTIQPGYGVDCRGREIILTEPRTRPVPAVASAPGGGEAVYYLVAAYQADEDQTVVERRPGVCLPEGTVRLSEEPLLDWRQPDQLQEGLELILAQAWIQNCQLSRPLALAPRRNARPSQQPYIAAGQTDAGNTTWEAWQVGQQTVGVLAKVDTTAARFRTTPGYTAHVAGDRFLGAPTGALMAIGFAAIVDATPQGFTLQVLLPEMMMGGDIAANPQKLRDPEGPEIVKSQLGWHVVWMGIEG
jgi:hypothetical protein